MVDDLIRLLLRPAGLSDTQAGPPEFDASREDTGKHVVRSSQPLYAGARVLLDGGTLPTALLTTRHVGLSYDSFRPAPVGALAKMRCKEGREGLRLMPWRQPARKR